MTNNGLREYIADIEGLDWEKERDMIIKRKSRKPWGVIIHCLL